MAVKNLNELKDELYKAFDKAVTNTESYPNSTSFRHGEAIGRSSLIAMGTIAQAIASIERELREAQEYGHIKLAKPAS